MITRQEIYYLAEQQLTGQCYCSDCGEPCHPEEDKFDVPGVQTSLGKVGVFNAGTYSSDCCGADLIGKPEENSND